MISIKDIPQYTSWGNYKVTVSWDYLLKQINSEYPEETLNMYPDFQRGRVWSYEKQIAYIEFCLKGGKSSRDILCNHPGWRKDYQGEYVLVDGLQRVTSAIAFINNELPVFGGYYLQDFVERPTYILRQQHFNWYVNDLQTRAEVLQWYLDLNSGGVVHTEEELDKVRYLLQQELSNESSY